MSNKTILITFFLVIALFGVALSLRYTSSPRALPAISTTDPDYQYLTAATSAVQAKCGDSVELLGFVMTTGNIRYAFTPGTCDTGSGHDDMEVNYDFTTHSVDTPALGDLRFDEPPYGGGFPHNLTQPISLQDWRVDSVAAHQTIAAHGGPENISAQLELSQAGHDLNWNCYWWGGGMNYAATVNATTGEVNIASSPSAPR